MTGVTELGYAILNQQPAGAPASGTTVAPEATRAYVIGRWQVEQRVGAWKSYIDYRDDGRVSGRHETFIKGQGVRVEASGDWAFVKPDRDQFRLELEFDTGGQWQGVFRIVGPDRIHNTEENQFAVRALGLSLGIEPLVVCFRNSVTG